MPEFARKQEAKRDALLTFTQDFYSLTKRIDPGAEVQRIYPSGIKGKL
jgi:hypothetical protein